MDVCLFFSFFRRERNQFLLLHICTCRCTSCIYCTPVYHKIKCICLHIGAHTLCHWKAVLCSVASWWSIWMGSLRGWDGGGACTSDLFYFIFFLFKMLFIFLLYILFSSFMVYLFSFYSHYCAFTLIISRWSNSSLQWRRERERDKTSQDWPLCGLERRNSCKITGSHLLHLINDTSSTYQSSRHLFI